VRGSGGGWGRYGRQRGATSLPGGGLMGAVAGRLGLGLEFCVVRVELYRQD
jgi:hypothetical protein